MEESGKSGGGGTRAVAILVVMSKRLQVVDWVRRALRIAKSVAPSADPDRKMRVLRAATGHSFPTADINEMLDQIEQG
jgi:hypothetical protein